MACFQLSDMTDESDYDQFSKRSLTKKVLLTSKISIATLLIDKTMFNVSNNVKLLKIRSINHLYPNTYYIKIRPN